MTQAREHQSSSSGSRMQPTDAFFWYAQAAAPQVRPLVAGLFMLDRAPEPRRFRATMERLVACLPRLRERVTDPWLPVGLPHWDNDADFDLDYHLRTVALHGADQHQLFGFTGALFATPLDQQRPLWEGYLIEDLDAGRAAFFLKLHHSIMDGAGAVALFDAMTQAGPNDPVRVPRSARSHAAANGHAALGSIARDTLLGATAGLRAVARVTSHALQHPFAAAADVRRTMERVRVMVSDVSDWPADDPLAARCTGIGRRLDGVTLSLARMRRLKEALGVSLNDLVLVAVTGALRRYHAQHHMRLAEVSAVVPMSLRDGQETTRLGNHVGAFHVRLPVGERDPLRRLAQIRGQTRIAKGNRQGAAYGALLQAVAVLPGAAFRAMARFVEGRVHLICSNVPGPPAQRYLAGAKIETVYPFAPVLLGIPLSIGLVSYGDAYAVGIDADPAAIPDPEKLSVCLVAEIDEIEGRVLRSAQKIQSVSPRRAVAELRMVGKTAHSQ
jgi:diacylglycerol O-acyltransferase